MADLKLHDFEDLFENAPCGYLVLDQDGCIAAVNTTFCEWTGRAKNEVLGKRLRDLLNVAGRIFYETHFAPLLRMQGFFDEVALDLLRPDGTRLPMLANARERRDSSGQVVSTRVTLFRATERRRYERELVDARETSDATNRELTRGLKSERDTAELREQFLAVLGHDLRNPLASIIAGIQLLLRSERDDASARVLRLMQGSTSRMSRLIDNVLDFARGRLGGGLDLSQDASKPLGPTLQQVLDEIKSNAPERDIVSDIRLDIPINVDHSRIGQLFSNLLGNAVAHGDPEGPIRVSATVRGGHFELMVSNRGKPIPEAALEHLFQPFYRGKVKPHREGLGLGLYIAAQIARAHAGQLDVRSDSQETSFIFRMPITA